MSEFDYVPNYRVKAAQWKGNNLEEMQELLRGIVYCDDFSGKPQVYVSYIEPYFLRTGTGGGYNILQFYAGDDFEVDPGLWVVVHEDFEIEILEDAEFTKLYKRANVYL